MPRPALAESLHAAALAAGAPAHARARRGRLRRGPRARPLAADEPAGLGSRPHRGVRGPVAGPPPRRPADAARGARRRLRRLRDAARAARRPSVPALRRGARLPGRRSASARSTCSSAHGVGDGSPIPRAGGAPRAPAPRRRCCRRCSSRACRLRAPAARRRRRGRRAATRAWRPSRSRAGRSRSAPRPTASPTTTSGRRHARRACPASASGARRSRTARGWHFVEGGGYERREWWTDEALALEGGVRHHAPPELDGRRARVALGPVGAARPDKPVVHVSWFEADAFARAHGARGSPPRPSGRRRRPGTRRRGSSGRWPWGEAPPDRRARTSTSRLRHRARRRATRRRSAVRRLGMVGDVWEWTASGFAATPASSPIPTASTPRSSSAATTGCCAAARGRPRRRVAVPTFRNWDFPAAPADLRRRAHRARTLVTGVAPRAIVRIDAHLERGRRAPTGRRRARRADQARSRSCRPSTSTTRAAPSCSTRSASCPSTTRRAPSWRSSASARRGDRRAHRRRRARRAGLGRGRPRRGCCSARWREAGTLARYVPRRRLGDARCASAPRRWCDELPELAVHGVVGDFERHLDRDPRAARRRAAARRAARRHDRQLPAGHPPAAAALDRAAAAARRPLPARDRPGQGPAA